MLLPIMFITNITIKLQLIQASLYLFIIDLLNGFPNSPPFKALRPAETGRGRQTGCLSKRDFLSYMSLKGEKSYG